MTRPGWTRGVGFRIAAAAVAASALGVGIVSLGVLIVGAETFTRLMMEHGSSAEDAHAMFDESVRVVLIVAVIVATLAAVGLSTLLGRRLASPLGEIGRAARRIAAGDYTARVPRSGPDEIAGLADSFNQMAGSLEEGERLRREFVANAAHELRTPLTNLKGYLEGLRDGVIPADEATFVSLSEEVERLVRLAASLDMLAAEDAVATPARIVEIDLVAAIRAAVDLASPGAERAGITLDVELPRTLSARADPDALAQVLGNLLQNATRYTPRAGRVTVQAERRTQDVLVTVTNTGEGIPEADLAHVFERFYRVDKSRGRAHGGAGIGLAIVDQLVRAMGGSVGAESAGGQTRFWFRIPA
ncbi:MAG: ATP-binding protein [Chloroflexota bacterium]